MGLVLHVLLHLDRVEELVTSERLAKTMGTNPAVFRRSMAGLRPRNRLDLSYGLGSSPFWMSTLHWAGRRYSRSGMRTENLDYQVARNVNEVIKDTMAQAEALFVERFQLLTLGKLSPISDLFRGQIKGKRKLA